MRTDAICIFLQMRFTSCTQTITQFLLASQPIIYKDIQEGGCQQARQRGLTGHRSWWQPDLESPASPTGGDKFLWFKPSSVWYFYYDSLHRSDKRGAPVTKGRCGELCHMLLINFRDIETENISNWDTTGDLDRAASVAWSELKNGQILEERNVKGNRGME